MSTPRIEVDLFKIRQNARLLVDHLAPLGISVVGVTKGVCGHPDIARAMLDGGVSALGDARVANVERMRAGGITAPVLLIRTPMLGQVDRVVRSCGISLNADMDVVEGLAHAACRAGRIHGIVVMVEMGDGREGLPPSAVAGFARRVMALPGVTLTGLGANFACLNRRAPDGVAMRAFLSLVPLVERACGVPLSVVSGGNSSNLAGLLSGPTRLNELRLGEAILLGRNPLTGAPIAGLATDAFTLVAEVIESKTDAQRRGSGNMPGGVSRPDAGAASLLALGDQDTDTGGLSMPGLLSFLGATSDHLLLRTPGQALAAGTEVRFGMNYSALMRAMSAPDIATVTRDAPLIRRPLPGRNAQRDLAPT